MRIFLPLGDVQCRTSYFTIERSVFFVYGHWFIQALGNALVGRCAEQKKDYSGIWIAFFFISNRLLGT